jgi:hypothetical protein
MAQKLYDLAESGPGGNFEAVVREFDDGRMSGTERQVGGEPAMQQQQQIQPEKEE